MENNQKCLQDSIQLKHNESLCEENRTHDKIKISVVATTLADCQTPNMWARGLQCLTKVFGLCFRQKKEQYDNFDDIQDEEITRQIEKIRKKKVRTYLSPLANPNLKTLVLDLDETLISTSFKKPQEYDFSLPLQIYGQIERLYVTKRFGLDVFLYEMSQFYELVVFATGVKGYVTRVLQKIDPKKRISHVLTRQHCTVFKKTYYIKNLELLGRSLKQTILVDDNSNAGSLQPLNFYKIQPFYGDSRDRKLLRLKQFLKSMAQEQGIEGLQQKRRQFESWQVNSKEVAKKQRRAEVFWMMTQDESELSSLELIRQSRLEVILETNE